MKKFILNGVEFNNFGANNYSNGMELISCYLAPKDIVQRVLNGEFHGVWLNPSAPYYEGGEFFAVFGTYEQYKTLYKDQVESQISKKMIDEFGWSDWPDLEITRAYESKLQQEYKDWWCK